MDLVISDFIKEKHSYDWDFWTNIKEIDYRGFKFQCQCKKKFYYHHPVASKDKIKEHLWNDFMAHKYGPEWNEANKFDELWDDCFPKIKRKRNHSKTLKNFIGYAVPGLIGLVIVGLMFVTFSLGWVNFLSGK